MWPGSDASDITYGDGAKSAPTQAAATALAADAAMYEQLELLGKACDSLSNRPFVCRTLVAYKRLNRPVEGNAWAKNLILRMNGQPAE